MKDSDETILAELRNYGITTYIMSKIVKLNVEEIIAALYTGITLLRCIYDAMPSI